MHNMPAMPNGPCDCGANAPGEKPLIEKTEGARKLLSEAVHNNFGTVGNDPLANRRLVECQILEQELKTADPVKWEEYQNKYY